MRAVHPDVEAMLAAVRAAGTPPFEALTPQDARIAADARKALLQLPPEAVASTRDFGIAGPGGSVPLRLYRPMGSSESDVLPCFVFIHGGGWVFGNLESHDALCRRIANRAQCAVVSVHYRLAPEHPFPAAVDDCAAAYAAIVRDAGGLRIDAARIAIGGDSAGGTLASVVALMGRDGDLPAPVYQVLIYPATNLDQSLEHYGANTPGMTITGATMVYFRGHYTPRASDRTDWRASPLKAASVKGVAPAFVITCGHDPLCAEGCRYVERLVQEGVRVSHLHLSDQTHGMITMTKVNRAALGLQDMVAGKLREVFTDFTSPLAR
ncbi:MAG: alpha/beta hydrolase [Hyphomicrobiales bacterium]|nr:MAG: alpha/beta hydrolase [Hyphomicrobiales bacterium]